MTTSVATTVEIGMSSPGIPFVRLTLVELGKAIDTRTSRGLVGLTILATASILLVPLLAPGSVDQTYRSYLDYSAMAVVHVVPVLSILTLTNEWTHRTVLTTFTLEPRRGRVVAAKIVATQLIAVAATAFAAAATVGALRIAAADGRDLTADLHAAQAVGFVLYVLLNVSVGVAFGALFQHTLAALTAFFAQLAVLGLLSPAPESAGAWLDTSRTFRWVQDGDWAGHTAQVLVSVALWIVLPTVAGTVRTLRHEIR